MRVGGRHIATSSGASTPIFRVTVGRGRTNRALPRMIKARELLQYRLDFCPFHVRYPFTNIDQGIELPVSGSLPHVFTPELGPLKEGCVTACFPIQRGKGHLVKRHLSLLDVRVGFVVPYRGASILALPTVDLTHVGDVVGAPDLSHD